MAGVIVDIDDVVGKLGSTLNDMLNKKFNMQLPYSSFTNYDYFEKYGMSGDDFFNYIDDADLYSNLPFEDGAIDAINTMSQMGITINMVTSRGFLTNAEQITADWLERGGAKIDRLIVVPSGMSKSSHYKCFGNDYQFIVDDLPHNILDAIRSGVVRKFAMINQPWNQTSDFGSNIVARHNSLAEFVANNYK
ncbi:5' nucleotidase, deoxy (Pyrimidine), cytosolic type C protein (NT5C) [compost metagenome]